MRNWANSLPKPQKGAKKIKGCTGVIEGANKADKEPESWKRNNHRSEV